MKLTKVTTLLYVFHWFLKQICNILQWTVVSTVRYRKSENWMMEKWKLNDGNSLFWTVCISWKPPIIAQIWCSGPTYQKINSSIVSKGAMNSFKEMVPPARIIPLGPLLSPSINYWEKYPTQTNFLKQYTCPDIFAISQKERPICSAFCFVSSCKEAKILYFVLWVSIKKPTYCQLLTSFRRSNIMFVNVYIECVAWFYWWTLCVLLIIWILYCWYFVPLVSLCPYCLILFLLN